MPRFSLLVLFAFSLSAARHSQPLDSKRLMDDVKELSSEKYQGRFTGTPELDKAAEYIAKSFQKTGLKKPFVDSSQKLSFLQRFVVSTESKLGAKNTLSVGDQQYTVAKDFVPRVFSCSGEVAGGLVFAGYGITASEYHYDDYAKLDAKGKVAVILRYEPQDLDETSVWQGKTRTRHAGLEAKVVNAKLHGAVAVILINNAITHPEDREKLDAFGGQAGAADLGIPSVQVRADAAEDWFRESGHDLNGIVKAIDRTGEPQSFAFPEKYNARLHIEVERVLRPTYNVAGYLPGETGEYIVVGAHYDHLGLGKQFSMAPSETPKLHPGADDNASGTAAVMEMARYFAKLPRPKRGILFVAFAGEEIGLLGSAHLAGNMPYELANCAAMINLDMIGRMKDGKFYIAGAATGTNFKAIVEQALEGETGLRPELSDSLAIGGSDHTSFSSRQVPALFFFSGLHADYHKPSDTWDKIEAAPFAKLVSVVAATAEGLANASQRPRFQKVEAPLVSSGGGSGGYGPYFGSVPDFGEVPNGVKFADIRTGSPAEQAGLKPGDILTEFDGKPVKGLQEYTYVLRAKKPGDEVEVKVLRGGETLSFRVKLAARR
jgi:hypothetical protein